MGYRTQEAAPPRRSSEPHRSQHHHNHQHVQPKYPPPPRRHTDGAALHKVHSRPEDYQNKPRPDKLFEYICFDGSGHPQECDEVEAQEKEQLDRTESNSSNNTHSSRPVDSDDYDGDSEDELTLPSCYHHDLAHRGNEYDDWGKPHYPRHQGRTASPDRRRPSPRREKDHHDHHHHRDNDSKQERDSDRSRRDSSASRSGRSEHEKDLIAKVAQHLRSHKKAYAKNHSTSEVVSELLSEVVRKVSDGGLEDGNLMKEVLREVQHAL